MVADWFASFVVVVALATRVLFDPVGGLVSLSGPTCNVPQTAPAPTSLGINSALGFQSLSPGQGLNGVIIIR